MENFAAYLLVGIMMFTYSTRAIVAGARSMASGRALIRGFSFPRAALPLSMCMTLAACQSAPPPSTAGWRWPRTSSS